MNNLRKKEKNILKLVGELFPSVALMLIIFLYESYGFHRSYFQTDASFLFKLFMLTCYLLFGIVLGGISATLLYKKPPKYYPVSYWKKIPYPVYFLINLTISYLILILLLTREIINHPALFEESYLSDDFLFSFIFRFIIKNFSPFYFTALLISLFVFFLYRAFKNYSFSYFNLKFCSLIFSSIGIILLLFNYGFLNAMGTSKNNVLILGVKGLKAKYLNKKYYDKLPGILKLKQNAYIYHNYFALSDDLNPQFYSLIYGKHAADLGVYDDFEEKIKQVVAENSLLKSLQDNGYQTNIYGDIGFASIYSVLAQENKNFGVEKVDQEKINKAYQLLNHPAAIIFANNKLFSYLFSELYYIPAYRDEEYNSAKIYSLFSKNHREFAICLIDNNLNHLPYPYYNKINNLNEDEVFAQYLDDEIQIVMRDLEKKGILKKTIIVLVGILDEAPNISAKNYKMPLIIYSQQIEKSKNIYNNFATKDILPTIFKMLEIKLPKNKECRTIFDNSFQYNNLFLNESYQKVIERLAKKDSTFTQRIDSLISFEETDSTYFGYRKTIYNKHLRPFFSLAAKKSFIRGDYKLDLIPGDSLVSFELYDIKKDPYEKINLIEKKASIAKKMKKMLYQKYLQDFHYQKFNDYLYLLENN